MKKIFAEPRIVALRKESVDRNRNTPNKLVNAHNVALRKESVDRNNLCVYHTTKNKHCRSPQGERG